MSIIISKVSKRFDRFQALDNVSLNVGENGIVALLGPSGSGKSTLLRVIAGLETPDMGTVYIHDRDATHLDVRDRNIGFVFQHYALFKHLTIRQNIAFGLEIRKCKPTLIRNKVEELLELIQLQGLGERYPVQLSGGQRQRVALARALAVDPQVLLLDEPFGALDAKVRKDLRTWLRRLHDRVSLTTIFVTHDQEEAMEVADEIVVMNHGKIEQVGSPAEVYDRPATPFVMSFVGAVNVISSDTNPTEVFIRPHDIQLSATAENAVAARVTRIIHLGWEIRVELSLPDEQIIFAHLNREQWAELHLAEGQKVYVKSKNTKIFPQQNLELQLDLA
jgi:sulfate/thiosulfate transport system ATP-binding protein